MYGWSESSHKWRTWALLKELGSCPKMPWLIVGDFNEVLFEAKKRGGNMCDMGSILGFRDAVDVCGLKDLGYSGYVSTWSNRRGEEFIKERLDRAFANDDWLELFPSFSVKNLVWD